MHKLLVALREKLITDTKETLRNLGITPGQTLAVCDITSNSPVIFDDPTYGDLDFTLDSISIDENEVVSVTGSSAYENCDVPITRLSTDAILAVLEWLENYKDEILEWLGDDSEE